MPRFGKLNYRGCLLASDTPRCQPDRILGQDMTGQPYKIIDVDYDTDTDTTAVYLQWADQTTWEANRALEEQEVADLIAAHTGATPMQIMDRFKDRNASTKLRVFGRLI